jgi:hypothetical protein
MVSSKQRSGTSSSPVHRRLHGGSSRGAVSGPVSADARRGFDQIVSTEPVSVWVDSTPQTAVAVEHARILVSFRHGTQRIESRADTVPRTDSE